MAERLVIEGLPIYEMSQPEAAQLSLARLRRALRLRLDHGSDLNQRGLRLLDKSIFAFYCDCLSSGVRVEADEAIRFRFPNLETAGLASAPVQVSKKPALEHQAA